MPCYTMHTWRPDWKRIEAHLRARGIQPRTNAWENGKYRLARKWGIYQ